MLEAGAAEFGIVCGRHPLLLEAGEREVVPFDLGIEAGERALVVSGSRDVRVQVLVNVLDHVLGAYGTTVNVTRPSLQLQGDDAAFDGLLGEMEAGDVSVLVVLGAKP